MTDARFESGAPAYAAYVQTVEGRLRLDIAWENFLSAVNETRAAQSTFNETEWGARAAKLACAEEAERDRTGETTRDRATETVRALDLGGGTGALALRFAALGWPVSVVDPSATMLALAAEAARAEPFAGRVTFHQSAAEHAHELFAPRTFDAAVCHNVLEYVSDPRASVRALAVLVKPGGMVSLVARNRAGESMRAAVKMHDLEAAERALTAEQVRESLYGGAARLFDARTLTALATDAGLHVIAERGVRVVADYLPASLSDTPDAYARLLSFELALGARPDFAAVARYTQIIARA
ncbi:MAG TPA: methyltransferase domain-containing protein [Pyrinomonadaceae bacterium]|jgi:2-polyprenyl-3-methyl-5-hydroxy-6-metoxy-1,4-benzoquinol methylase